MKLDLNITIDANDMTLLEFAALTDRIKFAIDPDSYHFQKRFVNMRLGHTEGVGATRVVQLALAAAAADAVGPPLPTVGVPERRTLTTVQDQLSARYELLKVIEHFEEVESEAAEAVSPGEGFYLLETYRNFAAAVKEYLQAEYACEARTELAESPAVR
jgi:hypothetical protein